MVSESFKPDYVSNVHFSGRVTLGVFERVYDLPGGVRRHSGLNNCCLHNCHIGNDVFIDKVHNYIANYSIGHDTYIENVDLLLVDGVSAFGNGVRVSVMNEGGGCEVPIFDELSAPLAYILTLYRHREGVRHRLQVLIEEYAAGCRSDMGSIGSHVRMVNCGTIRNVRVGDYAVLEGASILENGSINSHADAPVKVGAGVKCSDFIISSGALVTDSALVSRCFIGQACMLGKHYSALDSLFFANCQGLHGEAVSVFAGPYTVSHHKSTLLIAGMFSFFNAGSGSNQSNHMYKLGPIHQGVTERGVKTTSDSYLLWPAKVGAFTLVIGRHTKHSDTSDLPFSYLVEDNDSRSYLIPGINLSSAGTIRDAQKWPKRDARKDSCPLDPIRFELLSPYTVQKIIKGKGILENLRRGREETTGECLYRNCRIRRSALQRGIRLYEKALYAFLGDALIRRLGECEYIGIDRARHRLSPTTSTGSGEWVDLSGLTAPRSEVERLLTDIEKGTLTLTDIKGRMEEMHSRYHEYEWTWAAARLEEHWGKPIAQATRDDIVGMIDLWTKSVVALDRMAYEDAGKDFALHAGAELSGHSECASPGHAPVCGRFESHPFAKELSDHTEKTLKLAADTIARLT